ncbi:DUF4129 domain-containing protein [Actinocatenispora sera]|uniref:Protein-glutamine gamma-glutamyltransferase-like C-terminal domain-containing protein n=1 Tax=Actinocatenispora sera TaxID=390989 RepID=A0A810L4W4_9ACTN|nr:DUF4129 domain-containing protein [Actinocatenispora sera]BCJ29391.1 hypothetical protein Asera_34990 [Actinocatenispora sera]
MPARPRRVDAAVRPVSPAPPSPPPPGTGPGRLGWLLLGAVVLVAMLAVAASTTSVLAPLRHGRPDRLAILVTAGIVAGAGVVATVLVIVVLRLVLRGRPGDRGLRHTLRIAVPAAVVALALLALAGIARTGLPPATATRPTPAPSAPPTSTAATGVGGTAGGTLAHPAGTARVGDFDHDGKPDIGVDTDGDGTIDGIFVRQQDATSQLGPSRLYVVRRDGRWVGAIDTDGDGTIDGYVTLDDGGGAGMSHGDVDRYLNSLPTSPSAPPLDPTPAEVTPAATGTPHPGALAGLNLAALGWILIALVGAVVLAAVVAVAVVVGRSAGRRQRTAPAAAPDGFAQAREAMAATVVGSIDAMLADPDPRTAVIGAYARLLEGLAACGLARYEHEAPMEHLHRVLLGLRVRPEPLHALTELFERARFSPHPLTAADRDAALAALRQAAADLAAMAPTGAV